VSADLPPDAGSGLFTAKEDLIKLTNPPFVVSFILSSYSIEFNLVNVPKSTLSCVPFPKVYVIVNVVLAGA